MDFGQLLRSMNQIFEAGIAITAFSLFIRSLSFRLIDRVSRSFVIVLACIMVIFSGEAINGALRGTEAVSFWLNFQWVGIIFLPAAFQHFSDALLETTGRPSRGRRRTLVSLSYLISAFSFGLLVFGILLGPVTENGNNYPHPTSTIYSTIFTVYYLISGVFAAHGIWRAYKRTKLRVSRRRITYLLVGVVFLLIGAYPYMLIGSQFAREFSNIFFMLVIFGNLGVFMCLLLLAYAVAFFGVPWPDRIVRSRLLKWILRGPISVFVMLSLITVANQFVRYYDTSYIVVIPIVSVVTVLLAEHSITILFPIIERWLLNTGEGDHYFQLQQLSERLISSGDLKQFLEAVLAGVCDLFQVPTGFIAAANEGNWEMVVSTNDVEVFELDQIQTDVTKRKPENGDLPLFQWGDFWLYPLYNESGEEMIGMIGFHHHDEIELDQVMVNSMIGLGNRAVLALEDRRLQRQVLISLEELNPKVELLQRLRAAIRFDQSEVMRDLNEFEPSQDFNQWVKDAFSHFWGGPKLTDNPLLNLEVVQASLAENEGVPANALRAILRTAMDQMKPEGERKFTPEWTLYNILDMKFLEGRKVREVAKRLAVSEADLYRKQRVAIETVANSIIEMESRARES